MKRLAAATLASATALSLAVTPALAADSRGSSNISDEEILNYASVMFYKEATSGDGVSKPFAGSSRAGIFKNETKEDATRQANVMRSSYQSDYSNGWKIGTTYDVLVGTGIAAVVLAVLGVAASATGVLPAFNLPF